MTSQWQFKATKAMRKATCRSCASFNKMFFRASVAYNDVNKRDQLDSNQGFPFEVLGDYYLTVSKKTAALKAFSKAITLDPLD